MATGPCEFSVLTISAGIHGISIPVFRCCSPLRKKVAQTKVLFWQFLGVQICSLPWRRIPRLEFHTLAAVWGMWRTRDWYTLGNRLGLGLHRGLHTHSWKDEECHISTCKDRTNNGQQHEKTLYFTLSLQQKNSYLFLLHNVSSPFVVVPKIPFSQSECHFYTSLILVGQLV